MKFEKKAESYLYSGDFHSTRNNDTKHAAERIMSILYRLFPDLYKVIDVGCGIGTFLNAAKSNNATRVLGLDGDWVSQSEIVIPLVDFRAVDITHLPQINETFDLAITLEVAEHLPEECATKFIEWLCNMAPVILFSAAIPGQGGIGHQNEKWQGYWASIFAEHGYSVIDCIRPEIWGDPDIYFWYKQNILVYVNNDRFLPKGTTNSMIDLVHPDLYLTKLNADLGSCANWLLRKIKKYYLNSLAS